MPYRPPPEQTAQWEQEDWERDRKLYVMTQEALSLAIDALKTTLTHCFDDRARVTAARSLLALNEKLEKQLAEREKAANQLAPETAR